MCKSHLKFGHVLSQTRVSWSVNHIGKLTAAATLAACMTLAACDGPTGPKTGSLSVNIPDVPADVAAAVTVTGPAGVPTISVTGTRTIPDLTPGTYQVTAAKAVGAKSTFVPNTPPQTVEVLAGSTPATVTVGYTLTTGIVAITVSGVPPGANAELTLFDGKGFSVRVTESAEIGNLEPGEYGVQAASISADEIYGGTVSPAFLTVTPSTTGIPVQVTYTVRTGTIQLSSSGLPAGAVPALDIIGPGSYSATITGAEAQSLPRLIPGQYVITARNFDFGAETYGAATRTVTVEVTAGTRVPASFSYITRPPTLNLSVDGVYFNQSSQRYSGSVPLIAGRGAYLRVFAKANENNSVAPRARVRFYRGATVISTMTMNAPRQAVGLTVSERTTSDSWGVLVPGAMIEPGTSFLVDVDPTNTVREVNESDNQFPASGTPLAMDVRVAPTAEIRFVPIATSVNGLVGNVTVERVQALIGPTLAMFPIGETSIDVRATFSTSAPVLMPGDDNRSWLQIINELNTLRIVEGAQRHYVGILKTPYNSGIVGVGFVPGKTSLSWDASPAPATIAHELGHNWGRHHAPCGGPSGIDPGYPYPGGAIGAYGFNLATGIIQDAGLPDVMSYCHPEWVSDYTYEGVMNYRATVGPSGSAAVQASGVAQNSLIVWGRVDGGSLVLEPAFLAETRPALPARSGQYRVEGFDAAGAIVFSIAFHPEKVEDAAGGETEQFAFAVPMNSGKAARIVSLRLAGNGKQVLSRATGGQPALASISALAEADGNVRLQWNTTAYPMLVVRDPTTREVLAFARGGNARVKTQRKSLDVSPSDRVKSTRLDVQVRQ